LTLKFACRLDKMAEDDKVTPDDWKEQIEAIIHADGLGNTLCADCGIDATDSIWAVWNLGIFVCITCSGVHRNIGVQVSKVKSTQFDKWKNAELRHVTALGGNVAVNAKCEKRKPSYFVSPSECPSIAALRKYYIIAKHQHRLFEDDLKEDAGTFTMPARTQFGVFLEETGKKKAYLQLMGGSLLYYTSNAESYTSNASWHRQCTALTATLAPSDSAHTDFVLALCTADAAQTSLLRLRCDRLDAEQSLETLLEWVHAIRRAKMYYAFVDSDEHQNELKLQNADENAENPQNAENSQNAENAENAENAQNGADEEALATMTSDDVDSGTVLGTASKKGGGARSWRKRWWVLRGGFLYYFKEDFRANKKLKGVGTPQGNVRLKEADIAWDADRAWTGKQNALMLCTPARTFFVQPQAQNRDAFFGAVRERCDALQRRREFDFVEVGFS